MSQPLPTTHTLMYKELVLYLRPRSRIWQCRFKVDHKWQRASTKEYKFDLACAKAKEMLIESEIRKRNNLPAVTRKFKDVAKLAVERMLHERKASIGKVSYIDYMRVVERYLIPFFGNRVITNIDYTALDEFDEWRINAMGKAPTQSTILTHNAEIGVFPSFASVAKRERWTDEQQQALNAAIERGEWQPDAMDMTYFRRKFERPK